MATNRVERLRRTHRLTICSGLAVALLALPAAAGDLLFEDDFEAGHCGWNAIQNPEICDQVDNDCDLLVDEVEACATCGDGFVIPGFEACDDGNTSTLDGCSATCTVEPGYLCTGQPSVCSATCGDAVVAVGAENCDDGNVGNSDGCSATCMIEFGFYCTGSPSICYAVCGDGIKANIEGCDDANVINLDGCSNTCTIEHGFICIGQQPSLCFTVCGDELIGGDETCDDGGVVNNDGCSAICQEEPGWQCTGEPSVCVPD